MVVEINLAFHPSHYFRSYIFLFIYLLFFCGFRRKRVCIFFTFVMIENAIYGLHALTFPGSFYSFRRSLGFSKCAENVSLQKFSSFEKQQSDLRYRDWCIPKYYCTILEVPYSRMASSVPAARF